jgi:hypothetical protein
VPHVLEPCKRNVTAATAHSSFSARFARLFAQTLIILTRLVILAPLAIQPAITASGLQGRIAQLAPAQDFYFKVYNFY